MKLKLCTLCFIKTLNGLLTNEFFISLFLVQNGMVKTGHFGAIQGQNVFERPIYRVNARCSSIDSYRNAGHSNFAILGHWPMF